ncbi:MAG: response regulator [Caulobacteraceae bacterium]|nr:response regulator [Caulobacteraceae bacterium]
MSNLGALISGERINLERISFLLIDDNQQSLDIIGQVVSGFGVRGMHKCQSVREAKDIASRMDIDFVITNVRFSGEDGFDFLRWLRHVANEPNRYAPAVMVTGDTSAAVVQRARDCGAHFVIAKPITPKILLQRIFWIARENRLFIDSESYKGPDRRFKRLGPPPGVTGRRADDRATKLRDEGGPNLSQDEINAFMKPAKVNL